MSDLFFAWVTESDTTWSESFARKDEQIAEMRLEHSENNFATVDLTIKNPRVGLLAPGRYVWAWLAYQADDTGGTITPFFHGQLDGIPDDILSEACTLHFIGKPLDFNAQKMTVALSIMTAPEYDPIFVKEELRPELGTDGIPKGDPDVVLEGWPKLWHFDRVTNDVTASDIIGGEDGTEAFTADEIPRASVQIHRLQAPLTGITIVGKVPWTQAGSGGIDFGTITWHAYNGLSIASDWPTTGQTLSGGYKVVEGWAADLDGIGGAQVRNLGWHYENKQKEHQDGDKMSIAWRYSVFPCNGLSYLTSATIQGGSAHATTWRDGAGYATTGWNSNPLPNQYGEDDNQNIPTHNTWEILLIANVAVQTRLVLGVDTGIDRTETVTVKLSADLQATNVLPDPTDVTETVTLDAADVGVEIDGAAPLTDPTAYNFFPTDRGLQAIEHMICVGTAHLKNRARMVTVSWDVTFERGLALSCRKNATISDSRLPGGTATGKIIAYSLTASGSDLQFKGNITIGCCVGHGGTVSAAAGTPAIFEATLVEPGLQAYTDSTIAIGNEITYPPPVYEAAAGELQFPLTKEQVLVSEAINQGSMLVQINSFIDPHTGQSMVTSAIVPTLSYRLELKSLDGNQDHVYDLTATPLKLPKQIDLEAASWV